MNLHIFKFVKSITVMKIYRILSGYLLRNVSAGRLDATTLIVTVKTLAIVKRW